MTCEGYCEPDPDCPGCGEGMELQTCSACGGEGEAGGDNCDACGGSCWEWACQWSMTPGVCGRNL